MAVRPFTGCQMARNLPQVEPARRPFLSGAYVDPVNRNATHLSAYGDDDTLPGQLERGFAADEAYESLLEAAKYILAQSLPASLSATSNDGARVPPLPPPPRASRVHAPGPPGLALLSTPTPAAASTNLPPRDKAAPVLGCSAFMPK
ncbi:hypothetical protein N7535_006351 [Penicillium sp. DV-2018c]|nr:hypothetical protein N7461_007569 [Penicillium sp. DV-2018c]KAJ5567045.1 hypothetical protein N7535_006351 [Penicillium sp. DV-2018c]